MTEDAKINLQHTLSEKWHQSLLKIRTLDGFSNFLKAVPFKDLCVAAAAGPVIMVNISDFRSDAIIIMHMGPPVLVPLPPAKPEALKLLVSKLPDITQNPESSSRNMIFVLQQLWNIIVFPVRDQLGLLGVEEKSRIWWCPTSYLCALPLHAAGPYKQGEKNLPDIYVSSYTPTLKSLIRARYNTLNNFYTTPKLLLMGQPDSSVPHVLEEINNVQNFGSFVDSLVGKEAGKETVISALKGHSWAHFACHGHLHKQPFNSWFQLYDQEKLTVLDIAKAQLPNAEFAFLSACHTAAGDKDGTPDELIHLAGALQFSGFKGVVETLWAMVDDDGPTVVDIFYKHMFRNPNMVDFKDAAEALNLATRHLRKNHISIDRWINFIHIGA